MKEEADVCDEEKPSTSRGKLKEELLDERSDSGSSVILLENGECDAPKEKTGEDTKTNGSTPSRNGSKESVADTSEDNKENITNKLPFVEETILDEFSLLLFTCLPDAQVFEKELDALRAREEIEKKRLAAEKAVRIEKLKRKIRSKKRQIEKAARLHRKRLRCQKRESCAQSGRRVSAS